MFVPSTYAVALLLTVLSMLCWGSWANTQKLTGTWRFELFYWDYTWGVLITTVALGLTVGRTDAASPDSFLLNLTSADTTHLIYVFGAGVIFNIANILLVAAIAMAGMTVAFPVGIGLAMVIGAGLNYLVSPKGNPYLLFGGVFLVLIAMVLDAMAYRRITPNAATSRKGIILSLLAGLGLGLFYPFVAKAISGENHLGPYTVGFVFALGVVASTIPGNYIFMRKPVSGPPVAMGEYFTGSAAVHFWGVIGGAIWTVGTISNFVASYAHMVGPATSYALGQGATMVGVIWGVFVWKEFRGADTTAKRLLALMFFFFLAGLTCVALAPLH